MQTVILRGIELLVKSKLLNENSMMTLLKMELIIFCYALQLAGLTLKKLSLAVLPFFNNSICL